MGCPVTGRSVVCSSCVLRVAWVGLALELNRTWVKAAVPGPRGQSARELAVGIIVVWRLQRTSLFFNLIYDNNPLRLLLAGNFVRECICTYAVAVYVRHHYHSAV